MRSGSVRLALIFSLLFWGAICAAQRPGLTGAARTAADATISVQELRIPANARSAYQRGRHLLVDQHRAQDSLAPLHKAVQITPAFWQAELLLGVAYMDLHKWSEADHPLRQAIAVNERLGAAYLALGSCLLVEEKFEEAEQQLVKGLELSPEAAHGQYDLGRTYYALGQLEEAKAHAMKAVEIGPAQADVHFLLGEILLREGENPGALAEFEECLRLVPGAPLEALAQQQINRLQSQQVSGH